MTTAPGPTAPLSGAIIVTGGASGIGLALSRLLLETGVPVIRFDRDEAALAASRALLPPGAPVTDRSGSVTETKTVEALVRDAAARAEGLRGAACCAGIVRDRTMVKMTDEEWDAVLDVNLKGTFLVFRAVGRALKEAGRPGTLLAVSSIVGLRGGFGQVNYAASKAGLLGLVKSAAKELGPAGIRVNAVAPGYVRTPMTAALGEFLEDASKEQSSLKRVADPDDVARVMAFLLSDAARHVTGTCLPVDAGQVLG